MTDELIAALDDCLNAIASGATEEAALDHYPALADELRPMLEAAREAGASSSLAAIPQQEQLSSRAKFLARAAELRVLRLRSGRARSAPQRGFVSRLFAARALATGLAIVLALVIGTYGLVSASAQSLPGDPLYGVKRTVEQTQLLLASDSQTRTQLEEQFAERRIREAQTIITQRRETQIEFRGLVESLTGERWSVAGITVIVAGEARVSGDPAPGVMVEVSGVSQADGTVLASRVSVIAPTPTPAEPVASPTAIAIPSATPLPVPTEDQPSPIPDASPTPREDQGIEIEFTGIVESIGASQWQISGQAVSVTAATELRGNPQVGQTVKVKAIRRVDDTLAARRIEIITGTPEPTASRTPEPKSTEGQGTPQPTPTHTPGSGGGSGPSPSKTPEPQQTETPEPTHTPGSGGGSTPTATNPPTITPTDTPEPEEVEFEGTLQSINGNLWTVGGQAVTVTDSTEIRDNPQVGDTVKVRAQRQPDGSLVAERIEKR